MSGWNTCIWQTLDFKFAAGNLNQTTGFLRCRRHCLLQDHTVVALLDHRSNVKMQPSSDHPTTFNDIVESSPFELGVLLA